MDESTGRTRTWLVVGAAGDADPRLSDYAQSSVGSVRLVCPGAG
jgi:hypothetical protein